MRFAIMARILRPEYEGYGIQTQLIGLLRGMARINRAHELILLVDPDQQLPAALQDQGFLLAPLAPRTGTAQGRLWWDHIGVGLLCRQIGASALYAPAHVRPQYAPSPTVVLVPDMIYHRFPEQWAWSDQAYFRLAVSTLTANATAIVAMSQSTRQDMRRFLKAPEERIAVIYPGVPEGFERLPETATQLVRERYDLRRPFILYAGSSHPRKNLVGLIDAFTHVAADVPHELVLVGPRAWRTEALDAQILAASATGRVRQLGIVPEADLCMLYSQADLFVLPSLFEGFGFPALEALACGCPTITSDVSSLPEVVGEAGVLVPPGDTPALSAAIRRVLRDNALRDRMRRLGIEQARRFSWEHSAQQTLALLERAALERGNAAIT